MRFLALFLIVFSHLAFAGGTIILPVIGGGGGGGGTGTVTSVGLSLPSSIFGVTGTPVSISGTLTASLVTQAANRIWAGPLTGSAAAPAFRLLVADDIPSITSAKISDFTAAAQATISATAPIVYTSGVISCNVASGSQAGCLSSAEWTTFNNKLSGPIRVTTAISYSIQTTDGIVGVTNRGSIRTMTMPLASSVASGHEVIIKDESCTTSNYIHVVVSGSDTIDGAAFINITAACGTLKLYSDGSGEWFTI